MVYHMIKIIDDMGCDIIKIGGIVRNKVISLDSMFRKPLSEEDNG